MCWAFKGSRAEPLRHEAYQESLTFITAYAPSLIQSVSLNVCLYLVDILSFLQPTDSREPDFWRLALLTGDNWQVTYDTSFFLIYIFMYCCTIQKVARVIYLFFQVYTNNEVRQPLSLWLKGALLCLPGSQELGFSSKAPQCESPQVLSLAKCKCYYVFRQWFLKNFKLSYILNR